MADPTFKTPGPWGSGTGVLLTENEVDYNFYNLLLRIVYMEDNPLSPINIDHFVVDLATAKFYVHMTDLTILGPYDLPVIQFNFRGAWAASTIYQRFDTITNNGSLYQVLYGHTSDLTFDPGANDGMGHDYYGIWLSNPGNVLAEGGTADQVLAKIDGTDFNVEWQSSAVPREGNADDLLVKSSVTDFDYEWKPRNKPDSKTGTTLTLALDDAWGYWRFTNVAGCIVTIPSNAGVAFNFGTEITFRATTSGVVTIVAGVGVTLNIPDGYTGSLLGLHSTATIKKVGVNEWDLMGLLSPES